MVSRHSFLFVFFLLQLIIFGQRSNGTDEKLALQYFEQKEYAKANDHFENLYDKKPHEFFQNYYKSLVAAGDLAKAEKLVKRHLKANRNDVYLYVYLGRIYKLQKEDKKEKDAYDRALRELQPVSPYLQQLALAFTEDREYDRALEVYNAGRKANPEYPYYYERADIFKARNSTLRPSITAIS